MGPSRAVPRGGGVIGSLEPPQISQILESHASNLTIVATTKKSEPPKNLSGADSDLQRALSFQLGTPSQVWAWYGPAASF